MRRQGGNERTYKNIEGVCKLRELGFDTAVQQALQAIIDKDFFLETN